MQEKFVVIRRAFAAAFPYTIPIFAGFWFLGLTYGIYMNVSGFCFLVSNADEPDDFCRIGRIYNSEFAARCLSSASGAGYDADD